MIQHGKFDGYEQYVIASERLRVSVIGLGATVTSLRFEGRELTLGYGSAAEYLHGGGCAGAIVGRYANRIGGARFSIDGREYRLTANENGNQLHGGPEAFHRRVWSAEARGEYALRFMLDSPDGDNGYPGNLTAAVTYSVDGARLRIDFEGESDADTVFGPTTHMYFNLGGGDNILDTVLRINASGWAEVDGELIPTGRVLPAEGDFGFRAPREIGRDFDHCFLLDGQDACTAEAGGVRLELRTDYPALQLYTGAGLARKNQGFALEPQFVPDSPNRPEFPSPVLRRGEKFHRFAEYSFSNNL